MTDLIVIAGAPGSGKTTISKLLAQHLSSFVFDFGILREVHLKLDWSDQNDEEEQMAFENLIFILQNYKKHGYKKVILNDLRDFRVQQLPTVLSDIDYKIFSLVVTDDEVLRSRVEGERDSGFKDSGKALEWNRALINRPCVQNETKIDNTHNDPDQTVSEILVFLSV